jgi:glyoxylase-like metal-dependent hydrolase (beta-lactamase superfamily II)
MKESRFMPDLPSVRRFVSDTGVRVYRIACNVFPDLDLTGRVYLLLGAGPPTLVDTGSGSEESTKDIFQGLELVRSQFGESVQLDDVKRILMTHAHVDHFGGLPDILHHAPAEVGVHPLDCRMIAAYDERSVVANNLLRAFLVQAGLSPERQTEIIETGRHRQKPVGRAWATFALRDGDELDGLRFIHTPGHAPGHVCIRIGDILLTGDHILARTVSQQWPESTSAYLGLGHYLDSLEKIRRLEGIRVALGGHEPPIENLHRRIDEIRQSNFRRLDRLLGILDRAPEPLTIEEATRHMYAHQHGFQALLALTDVGARIEYLDQHGRLSITNLSEMAGAALPVYRYRPSGGCRL